MILVTGASGTVGSRVVRLLAGRDLPYRAMTRRPDPADPRSVAGDFDDPASLAAAVDGVSAVLLLSAAGPTQPGHDLALVRAALDAKVGRIVKLSAIGTPDGPVDGSSGGRLGSWHQPGEHAVRTSGAGWTVLRPTTFASNTLGWRDAVRAGQPVPNVFGTGRQGIVDPADVAAVAVAALTGEGLDGRTLTLTGPELLSVPDQVRLLGAALGRELSTVDVSPAGAREQMLAAGLPAEFADVATEGAALVRRGGNAVVTDDVAAVLGRPPRTFAAWAHEHRAAFA